MDRYQRTTRKLLGLAFIIGPVLYALGALTVTFGIGVPDAPFDWMSTPEAVIGLYGIILFIPIYLELARVVAQKQFVFGIILTVTGLLGASIGVMAMGYRVIISDLLAAGFDATLIEPIFWNDGAVSLATTLPGILFPLTSLLLGIGLLKAEGVSTLSAILMMVAAMFFLLAQAGEVAVSVTYPIAAISWSVALVPLGFSYLRSPREVSTQPVGAAA